MRRISREVEPPKARETESCCIRVFARASGDTRMVIRCTVRSARNGDTRMVIRCTVRSARSGERTYYYIANINISNRDDLLYLRF